MIMAINSRVALMLSMVLLLFVTACGHLPPSIGGDIDFDFDVGQLMAQSTERLSSCQGTIGECFEGDGGDQEEFLVDSESNRRILASRRYISYGALRRNHVPCSRRGASYYNCRPGASANPYRRGCSHIARCRR